METNAFLGLCRCCLSNETELSLLNDDTESDLKQKLFEITTIEVKEEDGLPQKLCSTCYAILTAAYEFRQQCIKMDAELKQQMETILNVVNKTEIETTNDTLKEIKFKLNGDNFNDDTIEQLEKLIKTEPVDSDDDCYYVLVIDDSDKKDDNDKVIDENAKAKHPIKSECETPNNCEVNENNSETEKQYPLDSFIIPDITVPNNVPAKILENEEIENDHDSNMDILILDENVNEDSNSHGHSTVQDDASTNEIVKTITGKIINQPDGTSYIKLIDADGTLLKNADQIAYLTENGELINEVGDSNNPEIILCEGDDPSQFQILKCDGSEFVIEYSDDSQIATAVQEDEKYVCECGAEFEDSAEYEKHQSTHNPGGEHLCNLCGKDFESEEILTGHMLLHNNSGSTITCPFCSTPIRRSTLTQHIKYVHTAVKPRCEICYKTFANPNNLKRHMLIHDGLKLFQCPICFKRFHQKITMQTHTITHKMPFHCNSCNESFKTKEEMAAHESGICKGKLKLLNIKEELMKTIKQVISTSQGKILGYACSFCKKMFSFESALEQHIETLHISDHAELSCLECHEIFQTKHELQSHNLIHKHMKSRNMKRFPCSICGKNCASQAMLVMHERVHTNERPFPCQLCSLRFKTKTHLRTHQLTHTREKKFGCSVCMKFFALKGNLVVHLRTHTGERPYVCNLCGEAFIDSKYLKKHKQKKHDIEKLIYDNEKSENLNTEYVIESQ